MKSYTDLKQSKKLAEILPPESADMHYVLIDSDKDLYSEGLGNYIGILPHYPCWSLTALLNITNMVVGRVVDSDIWICASHKLNLSLYADNPIDACYEMMLRLHDQKLL